MRLVARAEGVWGLRCVGLGVLKRGRYIRQVFSGWNAVFLSKLSPT